jgi:hypothetical protein
LAGLAASIGLNRFAAEKFLNTPIKPGCQAPRRRGDGTPVLLPAGEPSPRSA